MYVPFKSFVERHILYAYRSSVIEMGIPHSFCVRSRKNRTVGVFKGVAALLW